MDRLRINIAVLEPSHIIYEGLSNLIMKSENHFYLYRISDFDEIEDLILKAEIEIVILNPNSILNCLFNFKKQKEEKPEISWIALLYSYFDDEILKLFDDKISINESPKLLNQKLLKTSNRGKNDTDTKHTELSERETDVLVQLVSGLSNKEIADELNISIHTVMSHRKNITEKVGIKSLSGLTIYAITKKIIHLNE